MGDPKRARKSFERPRKPWDRPRMEEETKLRREYAFKTKTELWKLKSKIRIIRGQARKLIAKRGTEQGQKETKQLLTRLWRMGLINKDSVLEDALSLTTKDLMERRLQTLVLRKGFANTPKQARQFITHNHITIDDKVITSPSHIITVEEEKNIKYSSGFKRIADEKRTTKKPRKPEEGRREENREKRGETRKRRAEGSSFEKNRSKAKET